MAVENSFEPYVIGITGLSGSGKTFYVEALKQRLGDDVTVVGFDDYYKPLEMQHIDAFGEANYDLPSALYCDRFHEDLLQLIKNRSVVIRKYHFENYDAPEETAIVNPAPILLVEGLFVLDIPEVDSLLNYRIFVDCDMDLCFNRRIERDVRERGIPRKRSLHQWEHHVVPAFQNHIKPHENRCDLVIQNVGDPSQNLETIVAAIQNFAHPSALMACKNL